MELQDLQKEIGNVREEIYKRIIVKAESQQSSAFKAFEDKFSSLGFDVTKGQSRTQIDSKSYEVKTLTATYSGLSYELEAPEISAPYMGILNPLTFRDKDKNSKVDIWIVESEKPNESRTFAPPKEETERIKQSVSHANEDLEKLKNYLSNIDEAKVKFVFAGNRRQAYTNFEDVLDILIK